MTATQEATEFGGRLRAARESRGLSGPDVVYELRNKWPVPLHVSSSTLSRLERGKITEEAVDPFLVAALSVVYEKSIADLSEVARARIDQVITTSRCIQLVA